MLPPPPSSTRTDTLFPSTTLFRSLLIILGLGVAGYFYLRIYGPNVTPGGNEDTRYLYIPTGATFENVKDSLTHQGILKNINSFNWVAGMMEYPHSVKAGRYRITEGMNNRTLISNLRSGNQEIGRAHV